MDTLERRDSPAGEENPQQPKYPPDNKSCSPSSSASSSSSSGSSTYRKITDVFNRDRRQEQIPEADESPIVIIPQVCTFIFILLRIIRFITVCLRFFI